MWMTSDLPFAPPVGFSSDGKTLFYAPCWDPSRNMPCVAKRSTDAGVTWAARDINSGGETVFGQSSLPPNNKRCAGKRAGLSIKRGGGTWTAEHALAGTWVHWRGTSACRRPRPSGPLL